jgi:hypothetical protein
MVKKGYRLFTDSQAVQVKDTDAGAKQPLPLCHQLFGRRDAEQELPKSLS